MTAIFGAKDSEEITDVERALAKYCRNEMEHKAIFFSTIKHANQLNIPEWSDNCRPYLCYSIFANKKIGNLPITFSVFKDIGYGAIAVVNNKTFEIVGITEHGVIPITNTGGTVKGFVLNSGMYHGEDIVCTEVC